jgi:hypothetical protein
MIPLSEKQTLEVKDESGNVFRLKYLTESENQIRYMQLSDMEDDLRTELKEVCKIEFPDLSDQEISVKAYEKLIFSRRVNRTEHLKTIDEYIIIFLDSWQGGKMLVDKLRLFEKITVYDLIRENLAELTGLTLVEIKN